MYNNFKNPFIIVPLITILITLILIITSLGISNNYNSNNIDSEIKNSNQVTEKNYSPEYLEQENHVYSNSTYPNPGYSEEVVPPVRDQEIEIINPDISNVACTMDAKMCPDGSYVGRVGPSCEFAPCL